MYIRMGKVPQRKYHTQHWSFVGCYAVSIGTQLQRSKVVPAHGMKAYKGSTGMAPPILNLGTR